MLPGQCLSRQVAQPLHEGDVAIVEALEINTVVLRRLDVEGLAAAGKTFEDFKVPQQSRRDTGSFCRCLGAQSPGLRRPGRWPKERRKLRPGHADQQPQADPTAPAQAHGDPQGAHGANSFARQTVPVLVDKMKEPPQMLACGQTAAAGNQWV